MKISKEQMDHLGALTRVSFTRRMGELARAEFPERTATMSDDDIQSVIEKGIADAAGYGVRSEGDVGRYIYLMFALGFDFDRDEATVPWAGQILRQTNASPHVRMDMLCAMHEGRLLSGPEDGPFFP